MRSHHRPIIEAVRINVNELSLVHITAQMDAFVELDQVVCSEDTGDEEVTKQPRISIYSSSFSRNAFPDGLSPVKSLLFAISEAIDFPSSTPH